MEDDEIEIGIREGSVFDAGAAGKMAGITRFTRDGFGFVRGQR